jgi:hypothetical protein
MVRISSVLLALLALVAVAEAQPIVQREPPMGQLRPGQQVYVDDGSCPRGQIRLLTGGNHVDVGGTQRVRRVSRCVPRRVR